MTAMLGIADFRKSDPQAIIEATSMLYRGAYTILDRMHGEQTTRNMGPRPIVDGFARAPNEIRRERALAFYARDNRLHLGPAEGWHEMRSRRSSRSQCFVGMTIPEERTIATHPICRRADGPFCDLAVVPYGEHR